MTDDTLRPVRDRGWRSGLAILLRKEHRQWWGTRTWWVQALVWLAIINGLLALMLWLVPTPSAPDPWVSAVERDPAISLQDVRGALGIRIFFSLAGATALGAILLAQSTIIGERRSGTAAWVLSKPVSRPAFIISKLVVLSIGLVTVLVLFQGAAAYVQISLAAGRPLPPLPFLAGLGLMALHVVFYLSLALMLGTMFSGRAPVVGIPLAVYLGQGWFSDLVSRIAPWFHLLLPDRLIEMSWQLAQERTLYSPLPIVSALLLSVAFVAVAVWQFTLEDL